MVPSMDIDCMKRIFAGIRPDGLRDLQGLLALWERVGMIDGEEAAEWRRRILQAQSLPGPRPASRATPDHTRS